MLAARREADLRALEAFMARDGHARCPYSHFEGDVELGTWVVAQRHQHRSGDWSADRVERLGAMSGWRWDARRGDAPGG
jgi:hypothetical protein